MTIPGIVLAAGASRRLGQNKLLIRLGEHPVLYHVLNTALAAPLDPVILVLGYESEKALAAIAELKDSPKLRVVLNAHWECGRAESLKVGLAAVPPKAPGTLVLLGDMPLMTNNLIARVVTAFLETKKLCFPAFHGAAGRPVAIPRELFSEFEGLHNDESSLKIIQKYWNTAAKLELATNEEPTQWDIDTPEDFQRVLTITKASSPSL